MSSLIKHAVSFRKLLGDHSESASKKSGIISSLFAVGTISGPVGIISGLNNGGKTKVTSKRVLSCSKECEERALGSSICIRNSIPLSYTTRSCFPLSFFSVIPR